MIDTVAPDIAPDDLFMLALCLWRECRGGGQLGMTAVGCAIRNRVNRDFQSYYQEVVRRLQFSSLTAKGDPELTLYPSPSDPSWLMAKNLAKGIINNVIADVTDGATLYYAASIPFPQSWNRAVCTPTVTLGGQHFFTESA